MNEPIQVGTYQTLIVSRTTKFGHILTNSDSEVLLPKRYCEDVKEGDSIKVFIYTDSEDRVTATTETPKGVLEDIVSLKVTDAVKFGVFLDWGLGKDLFLPKKEMLTPLYKDDTVLVKICFDELTNRLYATTKLNRFLKVESPKFEKGTELEVVVYEKTDLGYSVIYDQEHKFLMLHSDIIHSVKVGQKIKVYTKAYTSDGRLSVAQRPTGAKGSFDAQTMILELLKKKGGVLDLNDKSSPDKIREVLSMSKKSFKEAIGRLYKMKKILIEDTGIKLNQKKNT